MGRNFLDIYLLESTMLALEIFSCASLWLMFVLGILLFLLYRRMIKMPLYNKVDLFHGHTCLNKL